jgi:LmbE family N-acetylglucosaminyl deacetylase
VLVVSPHPDDEAIGCGGTLRGHADDGCQLRVVFLTSGENGGHGVPPSEAGLRREAEAERAAEVLGIGNLEFWRQQDGALRANAAIVARLRTLVEDWQPDIVYAPHASEMHTDHRAAARVTLRAIDGLDIETRLFEVWTPLARMDEIVDITAHIDAKLKAIRAYESQCDVLPFDEAFRGLARYRGEMFSWPGGSYAEIFVRGST